MTEPKWAWNETRINVSMKLGTQASKMTSKHVDGIEFHIPYTDIEDGPPKNQLISVGLI